MVEEGALDNPKVDAIFGLHISPNGPPGTTGYVPPRTIGYRSGPLMASADSLRIRATGRQTHGAMPWRGIDPIVASAQTITALQRIVSRRLNISKRAGGAEHRCDRRREPRESVQMLGTLRTFDEAMRTDAKQRIVAVRSALAFAVPVQALPARRYRDGHLGAFDS